MYESEWPASDDDAVGSKSTTSPLKSPPMNAASGTASSEPAAYVLPSPGSHAVRSSTSSWSANVSTCASSGTGTFLNDWSAMRRLCSDVQNVIARCRHSYDSPRSR